MRGRLAAAVEAATAAGDQGDLMTRRDEFTNHAQSWRRAAVGAGAALVVTLGGAACGSSDQSAAQASSLASASMPSPVRRAPGEATLVGWLRESASYDPRFAFVALDGDRIVGHVMATGGDLDGAPTLGLGPLSVEPSRQGQGIGSRLMGATLGAARQAGASVIVLLGGPGYHARLGFVPAADLGISADPSWGEFFQARPLADGWGRDGDAESQTHAGPRGVITYPEPFARLGWRPAHPVVASERSQ